VFTRRRRLYLFLKHVLQSCVLDANELEIPSTLSLPREMIPEISKRWCRENNLPRQGACLPLTLVDAILPRAYQTIELDLYRISVSQFQYDQYPTLTKEAHSDIKIRVDWRYTRKAWVPVSRSGLAGRLIEQSLGIFSFKY
jgi:hypothetical protein